MNSSMCWLCCKPGWTRIDAINPVALANLEQMGVSMSPVLWRAWCGSRKTPAADWKRLSMPRPDVEPPQSSEETDQKRDVYIHTRSHFKWHLR